MTIKTFLYKSLFKKIDILFFKKIFIRNMSLKTGKNKEKTLKDTLKAFDDFKKKQKNV